MVSLKQSKLNAKDADRRECRNSLLIRSCFFSLGSDEILKRQTRIAQEFGIYDPDMLASAFFYFSDKVQNIWETKAECIEKGTIYIGN